MLRLDYSAGNSRRKKYGNWYLYRNSLRTITLIKRYRSFKIFKSSILQKICLSLWQMGLAFRMLLWWNVQLPSFFHKRLFSGPALNCDTFQPKLYRNAWQITVTRKISPEFRSNLNTVKTWSHRFWNASAANQARFWPRNGTMALLWYAAKTCQKDTIRYNNFLFTKRYLLWRILWTTLH